MGLVCQLSAMTVWVVFFFGMTIGVTACASWASLREDCCRSLLSAAPDAVCAGVRILNGLYTADDGYLQYLLSTVSTAAWQPGSVFTGPYGKKAGR